MKRNGGFSLIELIAVIIVIGVIGGAVAPMASTAVNAYMGAANHAAVLDGLHYAIERMARELREANAGTLNMSTTAPSFTRDDYIGTTKTTRTVSIASGGGRTNVALTYAPPGTSAILVDRLSTLTFAYYDQSGAVTTSATAVRYVEINLSLVQGGQIYAHRTMVALRNRS